MPLHFGDYSIRHHFELKNHFIVCVVFVTIDEAFYVQGIEVHHLKTLRISFSMALLVACWPQLPLFGWQQEVSNSNSGTNVETISLKGIVVANKKYSFQLESEGKRYTVKPEPNSKIALLLNKPFYDWKAGKVGVEVKPKSTSTATTKLPRIQFNLPSKTLYVIAKFRSAEQLDSWQTTKDKRLNFYLVTSEKLDGHEPTEDELYIAGKIVPSKKKTLVTVDTGQSKYRVRLGFRTATMNGFSIGDFKPKQTRVTLTGVLDPATNQVLASSIAFEPIQ